MTVWRNTHKKIPDRNRGFYFFISLFFAVVAAVTKENSKEIGAGFHGSTARRRAALVFTVELLKAAVTVSAKTAFTAVIAASAVVSTATSIVSSAAFTTIVTCRDCRQGFVFQVVGNNDDIAVRFFAFALRFNTFFFA